jgi:hypothetical protein
LTGLSFTTPLAWYHYERAIRRMRLIAADHDIDDLHDLACQAESAAAVEDEAAVLEAVGDFLGVLADAWSRPS